MDIPSILATTVTKGCGFAAPPSPAAQPISGAANLNAKRKIAVLFHRGDAHISTQRYTVHHLANVWREDGHDVIFLFGTSAAPPADILLLHINLSVVPAPYVDLAAQYPRVLNGGITDIRKSAVSSNLVRPGDSWTGPVIVKTDLNYAGGPEQVLRRSWIERRSYKAGKIASWLDGKLGRSSPFASPTDYEIYETLSAVPADRAADRRLVIERFLPETIDGQYATRIYQCLGDRWTCTRLTSPQPIVKADNSVAVESVEPHPEVTQWRRQLKMDYGKLDYVVHDGHAVLIDANKTIGASLYSSSSDSETRATIAANRRYLASGLYSYF